MREAGQIGTDHSRIVLEAAARQHDRAASLDGDAFAASNRDDPKELAKDKLEIAQSAQKLHINYPVLIDGGSLDKPYGGLDALPTSYFVNRSGKVVATQLGLTSKDDIEGNIHKALGE